MRYLILTILPFMAIFLQSTVFNSHRINGVIPDLLLLFIIFFSLINGARQGTVYGLLCGLLEDLYIGSFIGTNALSKAVTAYIVGRLQAGVFKENVLVGAFAVIAGTLINACVLFLLALGNFEVFNIDKDIAINTIYQVIYNIILGVPIYLWYYRSSRDGLLKK